MPLQGTSACKSMSFEREMDNNTKWSIVNDLSNLMMIATMACLGMVSIPLYCWTRWRCRQDYLRRRPKHTAHRRRRPVETARGFGNTDVGGTVRVFVCVCVCVRVCLKRLICLSYVLQSPPPLSYYYHYLVLYYYSFSIGIITSYHVRAHVRARVRTRACIRV